MIEGDVCIGICNQFVDSDITNLDGLSQVTKILGKLHIAHNPLLTTLDGLENLTRFDNDVTIAWNTSLASLDALHQVEHIAGDFTLEWNGALDTVDGFELVDTLVGELKIMYCHALRSYTAFPNLRHLGRLEITFCEKLIEVPDMVNLEYYGGMSLMYNDSLLYLPQFPLISVLDGDFIIEHNAQLKEIVGYDNITRINGHVSLDKIFLEHREWEANWHIDAFHNLTYIGGVLNIGRSYSLDSLDGFTLVDTIGGRVSIDLFDIDKHNFPQHNRFKYIGDEIWFQYLDSLTNLLCLSTLDSIRDGLNIGYSRNFDSFEGIEQFNSIGGRLGLSGLNLKTLAGLSHLDSIGGELSIETMDSLVDLTGLENLKAIGGRVWVFRNDKIESLRGIENIDPQSITSVYFEHNPFLTECNVRSICEALHLYDKPHVIKNNGPGCDDVTQVHCYDFGLSGVVYHDENQNKIQDTDERGIRHRQVDVDPGNATVITNELGKYLSFAEEGTAHTVSLVVPNEWVLTTDSASYTRTFNEGAPSNKNLDFGIYPLVPFTDLEVNLSSLFTRCNTTVEFYLSYLNTGTSDSDGKITVQYDAEVGYSQATPAPAFHDVANHLLTWEFDTLDSYEERDVLIKFVMPDESHAGEFIDFIAKGIIDSSGTDLLKDSIFYTSDIRCAIDPNDKMVTPPGITDDHYTLRDQALTYTIRFENEGNAEAINITITDTLDASFDISTFRVMNSSFPVFTTIDGNMVEFFFRNIWLQPKKTGFVTYEVRPKADVPEETLVENTAGIVFDFNDPIVTNTVSNTLIEAFCQDVLVTIDTVICTGNSYLGYTESGHYVEVYPYGLFCDSILDINLLVEPQVIYIDTFICEGESFDGYTETGIYFYDSTIVSTGCIADIQLLLTVLPPDNPLCITGISEATEGHCKIYPNPVHGEFYIASSRPIESIRILSADGIEVDFENITEGELLHQIDFGKNVAEGFYIVVIRQEGHEYYKKLFVSR